MIRSHKSGLIKSIFVTFLRKVKSAQNAAESFVTNQNPACIYHKGLAMFWAVEVVSISYIEDTVLVIVSLASLTTISISEFISLFLNQFKAPQG